MKVLNKFENGFVTIACAVVMWLTMFVGAYYWCYDTFDMDYDTALMLATLYGALTGYWLIKKIVLRFIALFKK